MKQEEEILKLARECIRVGRDVRPEVKWLSEKYDQFRLEHGKLSKAEADHLLYKRISGENAGSGSSGALKIRYWRTGRHVPANRNQCSTFGAALELNKEEMLYLMQQYYDRNDLVYQIVPDQDDTLYWKRRKHMEKLEKEYLMKVRPELFFRGNDTWESQKKNFRHLYYTDACNYTVSERKDSYRDRSDSVNYYSELHRIIQLLGEIPRRTMIRHLIILCTPYLSRKRMDDELRFFGYLPLSEEHTLTGGERLDRLVIGILELYEKTCSGWEPEECTEWFQGCCRILDRYFAEKGSSGLRFMDFKTLNR